MSAGWTWQLALLKTKHKILLTQNDNQIKNALKNAARIEFNKGCSKNRG
jgi:hypothetical protein